MKENFFHLFIIYICMKCKKINKIIYKFRYRKLLIKIIINNNCYNNKMQFIGGKKRECFVLHSP